MDASISSKIVPLITPILHDAGVELVELAFVKEGRSWYLRVYIDKDGGVDIEDCSRVSEQVSKYLDDDDPIEVAYFLEVSSPGAERPLKSQRDFERAIGRYVWIGTYEPIHGHKEFEGTLDYYNEINLGLTMSGKSYELPLDKVAKSRLAIRF